MRVLLLPLVLCLSACSWLAEIPITLPTPPPPATCSDGFPPRPDGCPPPADCKVVLCPPGTHCETGSGCVPNPVPPAPGSPVCSAVIETDCWEYEYFTAEWAWRDCRVRGCSAGICKVGYADTYSCQCPPDTQPQLLDGKVIGCLPYPPPPPPASSLECPAVIVDAIKTGNREYKAGPHVGKWYDCTPRVCGNEAVSIAVGRPGQRCVPLGPEGEPSFRGACEELFNGGPSPKWEAEGGATLLPGPLEWQVSVKGTGRIRACDRTGRTCSKWIEVQ